MGLIQKIKLSTFQEDSFLRIDPKFHILNQPYGWNIFNSSNSYLIPLKNILTPYYEVFKYEKNIIYKGIPTGREYLNEFGDIIAHQKITKENHPNRLKYKINNNCILISSLKGAKTPALNFEFDLSNYIFSNGFYIFEVSIKWNKKFILYILRTKTLKKALDNHLFRGIGISSYREDDLLKIKIPNIPLIIQNKTIAEIEPLENEIKTLKTQKKADLESINKVFSETFNIELEEIKKLDKVKQFNLSLQEVMLKNDALRTSFKWHKLEQIQSYMYKNINSITKLSTVILNTKNGWSPESSEVEEGTAVLGQEHILKNGKISLNPSKYTTLSRNNIENFYVKKNDFFVSRGNTLELVAMAGVVNQEVFDNILYPDLYIKVEFKESKVNKQYMAYLFNSFIGRVYFNHVAKGKNQTMVKVSSKEILDFYLPLPSMEIQEKIVKQIKEEIDIQKEIDNKILERQDAINALIEACIKQEQGQ